MSSRKLQRRRGLPRRDRKILGNGLPFLEALEGRTLLSVGAPYQAGPFPARVSSGYVGTQEQNPTYLPPSHSLVQYSAYLTGPSSDAPLSIATNFLRSHSSDLGLTPSDLDGLVVTDNYTDKLTGTTHLYFRQAYHGIEVSNANADVNVNAQGRVINAASTFLHDVGGHILSLNPSLNAAGAVIRAAGGLGLTMVGQPVVISAPSGPSQATTLRAGGVSLDDIPAELEFLAQPAGVSLTWNLVARTPDGDHWYNTSVDAHTGSILANVDWVDHASYNVYALPSQGPDDASRTLVTDPPAADPVASPFGWHDTDGVAGPEFTDTEGNNVSAQEDRDANDVGGFRPDGGPGLNFDFPIDFTQDPSTYQAAAITNLFYLNNELHDIHYHYGFDEVSGNFQVNNYGRGGIGGDQVFADAQDGSGTNNANFATPPDGLSPRMQMYIFITSPFRDGDLDNEIVIHEYGHGVSNRLTGGPANSDALDAIQSGGMGEGWSDWWSLMLTQKTTDAKFDAYPVGNYVLGQSPTGPGIRRFPYSYDMSIDPHTIGDYNGDGEVHDTGEIWTSALWDMNWLLIDKYGFNPNLEQGYTGAGSAGNILALQLVMDGMKLQPANPSFSQARDAILQADLTLTGGANQREIWTAFARRGMGLSFQDFGANSFFVIPAFDTPDFDLHVTTTDPAAGSVVSARPTVFTIDFNNPYDASSVNASDFTVNGIQASSVALTDADTLTFTFAASPVVNQGVQTMSIAAGSILRAGDESPIDAFSGQFRYDAVLLQVTSTAPPVGSVVTLPITTLKLNFNEPYDPASIGNDDLSLSQGSVTGFSFVDADTVSYSLSGITEEGTLQVGMAAGAVTDVFGNPGAAFSGSYILDIGTIPFPTPLGPKPPAGSLIYDPTKAGVIGVPGDTDSFSLLVDPGQKISVIVTPSATFRPAVDLYRSEGKALILLGSAAAGSPGLDALLQSIDTVGNLAGNTPPKTYVATVRAADGKSTGSYTVRMVLNSAIETENHGGATNDTIATAQSLAPSFLALNGTSNPPNANNSYPGRGAVLGHVDVGSAVVPSIYANSETFSGNAFPFSIAPIGVSTMRYQQIYSASDFTTGGVIDQLKFRRYIFDSTFNDIDLDLEIRLSYAATTVATASPTYANNIGAGAVTVYNGPLHLSSSGFGFPNPFDIVIDVANTFKYDPSKGDLLADFFIRSNAANFAHFFSSTPEFAQSATTRIYNFDVNSPVGQAGFTSGDPNPYGLITQFAFAPDQDNYSFTLKAGESATLVANSLQGGPVSVDLYNSAGTRVATGAAGTINDFFATAAGTYYARVSAAGNSSADYDLVVTRNAEFDQEPNDSIATAQDLVSSTAAGQKTALGSVSGNVDPFSLPGKPISGSIILTSDKITLGIVSDGSYIVGPTGIQFLGNEFVEEGTPLAGFTIARDGGDFTNKGAIGTTDINVSLTDLSNGNLHGVLARGVVGGNLLLERVILFKDGDEFVTVATRLTNLSGATVHNVAWLENLDADQAQPSTGDSSTFNDVVQGGHLVRSSAPISGFPDGLTIGLGSADPRTVVGVQGFDNRDPFQIINNPIDPDGLRQDIAINLAMNYGNIDPSQSVSSIAVMAFGRSPAQNDATYLAHAAGTVQKDDDYYRVTVNAGQSLQVSTSTPADQGGEFVNNLDPMVRVYNSAGVLVASDDNSGSDHRNARLSYKVPAGAGGTYYIQVTPSTATAQPTKGEYILSVTGTTGTLPTFRVTQTDPANGARLKVQPTQITVDFNDSVLLTSLQASDLKVDGVSATGLTIVDGNTVAFAIPSGLAEGTHSVTIAAGSILDLQDTPIQAYAGSFTLDFTPPRIVGINIQQGDIVPAGNLTYVVKFSEPMRTANLDSGDFFLFGSILGTSYFATSASYDASGTVLTLQYSGLPEDNYTLGLLSFDGGFQDVVGHDLDGEAFAFPIPPNVTGDGIDGGNFFVNFTTDNATAPIPVPLVPVAPLGSLIYQSGTPAFGTITSPGDTDNFTISLDASQTLAVFADPAFGQQVTITLTGPFGNFIGTAASGGDGQEALLPAVQTPAAGLYTITIGSTGAVGRYSVRVLLNAGLEEESHGGGTNDDIGSAQPLGPTTTPLTGGADRAAVLGSIHSSTPPGDLFVAVGGFGGQVNHYDKNGNLVGVIDTLLFDSGVISDVEIGPDDSLYIALDINGTGGDGELLQFATSGALLNVIPVPTDSFFGFYHPFGFDVAPDGTFWVTHPNSGYVLHLDSNGFELAEYFTGGIPEDAAVAPDGTVYVGDPSTGQILKLDPSTGTVTPFAFGVTVLNLNVTAAGDVLAGDFNSGIYRFDPAGNVIQFIPDFGVTEPQDSPDGDIWATSFAFGNLTRYDSAGNFLGSIGLPGQPIGLAIVGTDGPATPADQDLYSITLEAGQSLAAVAKALGAGNVHVDLLDSSGNTVATGTDLAPQDVPDGVPNGGFETGDFTGWTTNTTGSPFVPWTVSPAGFGSGFFPPTSPQEGTFDAWNGFDGAGPMMYTLYQDVTIPTGSSSISVAWKDRLQWNFALTGTATQARTYEVYILDPSTNAVLATGYTFSTGTAHVIGDTGWQDHSIDVSAFAGTTIRLFFEEDIPESFTGPGQYELDAVHLTTGGSNVDSSIAGFVAPSAGTYYLRVTGSSGTDYSVVATRDAVFDVEGNNTIDKAEPFGAVHVALGYVGGSGDPSDDYSFSGTAGQSIHLFTTTPSDGPGEFSNTLNPHLRLFDAVGNLIAEGTPTSDGRNEEIIISLPSSGIYSVEVSAEGGTSGEYILDPIPYVASPVTISATDRRSPDIAMGATGSDSNGATTAATILARAGASAAGPIVGASATARADASLVGAIAAPSQISLTASPPRVTAIAPSRSNGSLDAALVNQGAPVQGFGSTARAFSRFPLWIRQVPDAAGTEGEAAIQAETWSSSPDRLSNPASEGGPHHEGSALPASVEPEAGAVMPDALDECMADESWASSLSDRGGSGVLGLALSTLAMLSTIEIKRRTSRDVATRKPGTNARRPLRVRPHRA